MHLGTLKIFCLPDDYEVIDFSLEDIRANVRPVFSPEEIRKFDLPNGLKDVSFSHGVIPGALGLNDLRRTGGINVTIQSLARISPIRRFFLSEREKKANPKGMTALVATFGELMRKMHNLLAFRDHVSPHEFVQAVNLSSDGKFKMGTPCDPIEFLVWLLHTLHHDLGGTKTKPTVISESLMGKLKITTHLEKVVGASSGSSSSSAASSGASGEPEVDESATESVGESSFFVLPFDLPLSPVFKDEFSRMAIPQVSLVSLLSKYDGKTVTDVPIRPGTVEKRTYSLDSLPPYVIFHFKRFYRTAFFTLLNPTMVNFPVRLLDLEDCITSAKSESSAGKSGRWKYNLMANIFQVAETNIEQRHQEGVFRADVFHRGLMQWFEVADLTVTEKLPQETTLREAYIQIYERQATE